MVWGIPSHHGHLQGSTAGFFNSQSHSLTTWPDDFILAFKVLTVLKLVHLFIIKLSSKSDLSDISLHTMKTFLGPNQDQLIVYIRSITSPFPHLTISILLQVSLSGFETGNHPSASEAYNHRIVRDSKSLIFFRISDALFSID